MTLAIVGSSEWLDTHGGGLRTSLPQGRQCREGVRGRRGGGMEWGRERVDWGVDGVGRRAGVGLVAATHSITSTYSTVFNLMLLGALGAVRGSYPPLPTYLLSLFLLLLPLWRGGEC